MRSSKNSGLSMKKVRVGKGEAGGDGGSWLAQPFLRVGPPEIQSHFLH